MSSQGKRYGLILSKKKVAQSLTSKPSVFGSDSDEEENRKSTKNVFPKQQPKIKTQLEIQKVLEEDPNAYEYDSIYDSMKEIKESKSTETTLERKPKYIQTLLKAADKRKKEYERRVERKIQKEREEEGEKFADKEAFVTSAYKRKMQELQEEEEKEKRMDAIEALMDVTKQKDLTGFYRHLLKEQTSGPGTSEPQEYEIKKEKPSSGDEEIRNSHTDRSESSGNKSPSSNRSHYEKNNNQDKAKEALRQFQKSNDSKNNVNAVDDDSDFSSDSESSSSDSSVQSKESKEKYSSHSSNSRKRKSTATYSSLELVDNKALEKHAKHESEDKDDNESSSESDSKSGQESSKIEKPVLSGKEKLKALFAKRTVGDAFTAAQERFFQRQQRTAKLVTICS